MTGETKYDIELRRFATAALKGLWLQDDGTLIPFPERDYPPSHKI